MNELETIEPTTPVVDEKPGPAPEWNPVSKGRGRPGRGSARGQKAAARESGGGDARSVEAAWQGLWIVIRIVARLLGFEADVPTLPDEEARADALALAPVIDRHPTLARVLSWVGAPVVIVQRIAQHFHRKAKEARTVGDPPGPRSVPSEVADARGVRS